MRICKATWTSYSQNKDNSPFKKRDIILSARFYRVSNLGTYFWESQRMILYKSARNRDLSKDDEDEGSLLQGKANPGGKGREKIE